MQTALLLTALASCAFAQDDSSAAPQAAQALAMSSGFSAPLNPAPVTLPSGKRLVSYYANWATYATDSPNGPPYEFYQPADLPISKISDINYAFWVIGNKTTGTMSEVPVSSDPFSDYQQVFNASNPAHHVGAYDTKGQKYFGNFGQFMKLKQTNQFNFGLSIGGWIGSTYFSSAMKQPAAFIDGIFDVLNAYPGLFNRVDVDWEYVQNTTVDNFGNGNEADPADPADFAVFLKMLRSRLNKAGLTNFEITSCVTPNPSRMTALPFAAMIKYLDFFNIMTYDFGSSAWGDTIAAPQSNVYSVTPYAHYSVDLAVKTYLSYGVPASKINIGVAMYSQIYGNTTGMGQPSSGAGSDSYNTLCPSGNCDYRQIPLPGSTEYWDSASKSAYTLNPSNGDMLVYDSIFSVAEKCQYVWDNGLAGMIAWESSNDVRDVKNSRSLTAAMNKCLASDPRRNHGTPCNGKAKGCAATALATCSNNAWVVKDCPSGQVCKGTGSATKCALP
ncbi:hypothetical protein HDU98_003276 [Podochytrium sp. JEL0797]|nr:hypothetical protein HDU98_003276 [Podochytrium sp. JEL0797]